MSVMFSFLMDLHLIYMYFIFGSEVRRLIWSCPGSRSNGPTWLGGSRHWSRGRRKKFWVICQRYALANNSEFLRLPLLQCLLPPNQVGPLLLDPGQLQISRLTPLQKMKYIQIKCKIHQKRKHYNTHSLRAPFFFLRAYGPLPNALPGELWTCPLQLVGVARGKMKNRTRTSATKNERNKGCNPHGLYMSMPVRERRLWLLSCMTSKTLMKLQNIIANQDGYQLENMMAFSGKAGECDVSSRTNATHSHCPRNTNPEQLHRWWNMVARYSWHLHITEEWPQRNVQFKNIITQVVCYNYASGLL